MGECGCSSNNEYFILPARSGLVYLLTLSPKCEGCDAPPGITVERFKGRKDLQKRMGFCEFPPVLPFEKWGGWDGVAIITGHRKHEFVKALKNGLIGVDSKDFAHGKSRALDETAAETILEDMYTDSTVTPFLVEPRKENR